MSEYDGEHEVALNWYVSRTVEFHGDIASRFTPGTRIVGHDGSSLTFHEEQWDASEASDRTSSFAARLAGPGRFGGHLAVEVLVSPFSDTLVELGLRPSGRRRGLAMTARHYFSSAWSVLDEAAEEFSGARDTLVRAA